MITQKLKIVPQAERVEASNIRKCEAILAFAQRCVGLAKMVMDGFQK